MNVIPNSTRSGHYEMKELDFSETKSLNNALKNIISNLDKFDDYSYEKHTLLMIGNRGVSSEKKSKKAFASCIKKLVSANRTRYNDQYFNLDLTYISKRIITMGYPSFGCESLYRNNFKDVKQFFKKYHPNHVKIYNLCMELHHQYDPKVFQNEGFEAFNFKILDHHACKLSLRKIFDFCVDAFLFEAKDPENVIAIHCKAGKGRTGMITCCYLLFIGCCKTFEEAILFFGKRRTINGEGLTIASQIRYLRYFEQSLRKFHSNNFPQICLEFLENPEMAYEKYIPHKNMNLRFINFGPLNSSVKKIKFEIEDLEGNLYFHYKLDKKKTYDEKSLDSIINLIELKDHSNRYSYSLVNDQLINLEDDIKLILHIDKIKLISVFNLNFLRSPKENSDIISYNELGVAIPQKGRASNFKDFGVKEPISYVEFKTYDFEKWYSNKKAQHLLPEEFSLIIGFDEIQKRDSKQLEVKI